MMKGVYYIYFLCLLTTSIVFCYAKPVSPTGTGPEQNVGSVESAVFGDVNILVVTDTHSWLAGHAHKDQYPAANATIGNITSFVSGMKKQANAGGKDLFFFDNGDVVDGTGLSNASPIDGQELFPLLMEIPFDAMAIGNHECYDESTLREMVSSGYISSRNGTYLSSNVYIASTMEPIASRYTILEGDISGIRLLVFGVLYDMTDNSDYVYVQTVEEMVQSEWFTTALRAAHTYDAVVVLAHMDYKDPLITVLLDAIRSLTFPELAVQFLTGHSHIRAFSNPDTYSSNLEAGNYYNTIGYSSFNLPTLQQDHGTKEPNFFHTFYEPNTEVLAGALNVSATELVCIEGLEIDENVHDTRNSMGLFAELGNIDSHYFVDVPVASENSLYKLYLTTVAPSALFTPPFNTSQVLVSGTGLLRYDLFQGPVVVDDIWTLCPFSEPYYVIEAVLGSDLQAAFVLLNSDNYSPFKLQEVSGYSRRNSLVSRLTSLPNYVISSQPESEKLYDVLGSEWDVSFIARALGEATDESSPEFNVFGNVNTTEVWLNWMSMSV